jgi:hypothetical protein
MRLYLLIALFVLIIAPPVPAGPWLREDGAVFSSTSVGMTRNRDINSSTYLEYGLTGQTTLGFDLNLSASLHSGDEGRAVLFFRRALGPTDRQSKFAYELGMGAAWGSYGTRPRIKAGLTWGRGIAMGDKSGWVTLDGSVILDLKTRARKAKIDGTIGLNLSDAITGIFEINLGHSDGNSFATVAPSLVLKPKFTKFQIQLGVQSPIGNSRPNQIKIGLWREF